ncbi:MAG: hypothetical protein WCJ61_07975 [Paludibacter sp.]
MSTFHLKAENSYLDKEVNLQGGQKTFKEVLNQLSNQTGCIFSYDPTIIVDNQIINYSSKTKLSLRSALLRVLPKSVDFKANGKYIVLKRFADKGDPKIEKNSDKLAKLFSLNQKHAGKIDNNPTKERLVLPPITDNSDFIEIKQTIKDSVPKLIRENASLIRIESNDSVKLKQVNPNQDFIKPVLTNEILINAQSGLKITTDSAIIAKQNFGGFLKKNGFWEVGMSLNKKLGAISVRTGLYNVYSILSIASDYNKSYLLGIGAGVNVKLNNNFSIDFDLLRNSLYAGKTYSLDVRASNTQFSPILNYRIGKSFKISGGPTLHLIKSSYVSSVSATDLGVLVAVGLSMGIKIDLKNLLFPNS